jgi:hypothetical protein
MPEASRSRSLPGRRRTPPMRLSKRWSVSVEWEPRDLWIGVFLKRERDHFLAPALHVYVCPLPTLVLHVVQMGAR